MSIGVLVLDFDGVVIESNDAKTLAFEEVFSRFPEHHEAMMSFHFANISSTRFVKFEHLCARIGTPNDPKLMSYLAEEFSTQMLEKIKVAPLVPGAEAFLREYTPRVPVYLASVTPADELAVILASRGLDHWFRNTYGCPPWTKAGAINDILGRERMDPAQAMLIGDSAGDQEAAEATGVRFVGRESGLKFGDPTPVSFSDLHEIGRYIDELIE